MKGMKKRNIIFKFGTSACPLSGVLCTIVLIARVISVNIFVIQIV
jgi:hypothetical protein